MGVNIKKGGSDPELKPLEEYPPWVADLATPQETMFDLRKKLASKGQNNLQFQEVRPSLPACVVISRQPRAVKMVRM